jgi:hypothetical protein
VFIFVGEVVDGCSPEELDPKKKLDSLMHLAELCIEVIQQNEEYHAEVELHVFVIL